MPKRAVFIDRDGTLSEEVGYLNHASRFRLLPRSAEAIRLLNEAGVPAVVVTNQAGVARGYFPEERILEVHERMKKLLAEGGARLDGVYYCPHHPTAGVPPYRCDCNCRKPKPGLIEKAVDELDLQAEGSYMIGDKFSDVQLGHLMKCSGILVKTGYGLGEWEYNRQDFDFEPEYVAEDLLDAVQWLLQDMKAD
ncbi:MAG TPA: HAD family hydrolase [bacterium]|nr:HAD family hydrolase [bacterium]